MKRNWLIFTALLLITSMACNVMGSKDSANPQDSQAPAQETTESKSELSAEDEQAAIAKDEQAAVVEAEQASTAVEQEQKPETSGTEGESVSEKDSTESDLEKISSYRSQQTWQAEFADGVVEQVIIEEEIIREPNAYHMTTQVNKVDSVEVWEFIRLGETQWTRFDSDWMKSQIEQIDFQDSMSYYFYIDYATYLESAAFSREGEETVNGIKTRRYRATTFEEDESSLVWLLAMQSSYSIAGDATELENISDEYWLADEKDLPVFVVRHVREGRGKDANGQVINFKEIFEIYDLNKSFAIEAPEDQLAGWPPDDIPQCTGGSVETSTGFGEGGMILFTCPGDFDTVSGFYQDELEAAGWSQSESNKPMDTMLLDVWTKDSRTMNLMIQQEGDACTVTITVEGV